MAKPKNNAPAYTTTSYFGRLVEAFRTMPEVSSEGADMVMVRRKPPTQAAIVQAMQEHTKGGPSTATYSLMKDGEILPRDPIATIGRLAVIFGLCEAEAQLMLGAWSVDNLSRRIQSEDIPVIPHLGPIAIEAYIAQLQHGLRMPVDQDPSDGRSFLQACRDRLAQLNSQQ